MTFDSWLGIVSSAVCPGHGSSELENVVTALDVLENSDEVIEAKEMEMGIEVVVDDLELGASLGLSDAESA